VASDTVTLLPCPELERVPLTFGQFRVLDPRSGTIQCPDPTALVRRRRGLEQQGTELTAVRHAESEANASSSGPVLSGRQDTPLTDKGREQAAEAARELFARWGGQSWLREAIRSDNLPVLYSSPSSRAADTADALASLLQAEAEKLGVSLQIPVRCEYDLQEIDFGHCEGRPAAEVAVRYPNFARGLDFLHRFPGGESGVDVMTRVDRFLQKVEQHHAGRKVVVFGHTMSVGFARLLLGEMDHKPDGALFLDRDKVRNAVPLPLTQPQVVAKADGFFLSR
jgi:broad specificity phosphatase PhoE